MATINTLINNISNQNIRYFFENKIASFKPEKDVFTNAVKEESPYSDPVKIGHAVLYNHEELLVFTCEYNKELTARSAKKQQFEIAKKVLKEDFKDGAIFIFYDGQGNFRFSFIRRNYGDKSSKYSNWKRYTYYVSPSETNKTFKTRIDSCSFKDLDSIQEAFSVEKLTKDFYNELFAWYKWALSDEIGVTFPNNTETSEDDRVKLEEQIIRLITRLLFVWFVKQKKIVPNTLFETDDLSNILIDFEPNDKNDGNYYNAILQNLFFATLNKEITERTFAKKVDDRDIKTNYRYAEMFNLSEQEIIDLFKPIPFLNGGLFECLDKTMKMDGVQYALDGFSRNATKAANGNFRHRAFIPNCVFFDEEKGIIPLLKRYNFTVEENAPNEIQVALDPELLGKVFENLLGAFNPETKDTARKQSGSFYTPREIVDYMVNESLSSYLHTHFPKLPKTLIQSLFQEEDLPTELKNNHALSEQISNTLRQVKILDPACGSGAFPMGILNKMVAILEKLDCKNEKTIHDLKLHLIEECIYGIDIQSIAVQISKLRFFISLVVEQDVMDVSKPEDNYNVLTLPNLETKFVAANTLIGIKRKPIQGNLFEDPDIETTKQQLLAIRKEHFYAKTVGAKKRLRAQDAVLRDTLNKLLDTNKSVASEDAIQFSQWNPYDQNTSSPFFDTEWMFGLEDGFDVVIGNPPYIKEYTNKEAFNGFRNTKYYQGKMDLWYGFACVGIDLLKDNGTECFIAQNNWVTSSGASIFRNKVLCETKIKLFTNFWNYKVFKSAGIQTMIYLLKKEVPKKSYPLKYALLKDDSIEENELVNFLNFSNNSEIDEKHILTFNGNSFLDSIITFNNPEIDNVLNSILDNEILYLNNDDVAQGIVYPQDRLNRKNAKILGKNFKINDGIFQLNQEELNNLNLNKNEYSIIKPFYSTSELHKYFGNKVNTEWIIYTKTDVKNNIDSYPKIKCHLNKFAEIITSDNRPYGLHRARNEDFFTGEKIISLRKNHQPSFTYTDFDCYVTQTFYSIKTNRFNLKYLTALLNSKLIAFWLRFKGKMQGNNYQIDKEPLVNIPIVKASFDIENLMITKVNQILEGKKAEEDTSALEHQIDVMVYHLYELNYEDALVIDEHLSKEDFERYKI